MRVVRQVYIGVNLKGGWAAIARASVGRRGGRKRRYLLVDLFVSCDRKMKDGWGQVCVGCVLWWWVVGVRGFLVQIPAREKLWSVESRVYSRARQRWAERRVHRKCWFRCDGAR